MVSSPGSDAARRTVPSCPIEPGTRLIGRYRLDELLENATVGSDIGTGTGTTIWRAIDEVLSRPVNIRTLAAGTDRAAQVLAAARASARAHDHRFLRVLDASTDDGVVYVVSEWVQGRSLATALREGPLPPAEAARVVGEVAAALASAHEVGLSHLCLLPASVLIADSGQVKVVGLGVDAAIRGIEIGTAADAAVVDVRGCGALLYAALTERWPLGGHAGHSGLAPAPQEHGRACTPRQVRNGIPRDIDTATIRALQTPLAFEGVALSSPAALARALAPHHGAGAQTWHGWDQDRRDDERTARTANTPWIGQTDAGSEPLPGAYVAAPHRGAPGEPSRRARRASWSIATTVLATGIALAAVTMVGLDACLLYTSPSPRDRS